MKFILAFTILLILVSCNRQFYQNQYRDYSSQISSTAQAIAMAPSTVQSFMGYKVDFAIGTSNGSLYFGNLKDNNLRYFSSVSSYPITNLTWTNGGLHIVTKYEIKVIDPSLSSWSLLYMNFPQEIKKAVFGRQGYNILTAIRFDIKVEVFRNASRIQHFLMFSESYVMSFNSSGESLFFISGSQADLPYRMLKLDIFTGTVSRLGVNFQNPQEYLQFVPLDGYRHLASLSNQNYINQWNNDSIYQTKANFFIGKKKFTGDAKNLVGQNSDPHYSIEIFQVDLNQSNFVSNQSSQLFNFDSSVVDIDTKRQYILALISGSKVAIISTSPNPNPDPDPNPPVSYLWVIIVGSVFVFLLIVGIVVVIMKRKRMRQKQQNGDYIQQNDIANPVAPPSYDPSEYYKYFQQCQDRYNQGLNSSQVFQKNHEYLNENKASSAPK